MIKLFAVLVLLYSPMTHSAHGNVKKQHIQHNVVTVHRPHTKKNHLPKPKPPVITITKPTVQSTKEYDHLFIQWGAADYKLIKALCTAESGLKAKARSSKGARGLCQLMPGTWNTIAKANHLPKKGYDNPTHSIHAAVIYYNDLNQFWEKYQDGINKRKLTLASYNAGPGNIARAKQLCGAKSYEKIIRCLPHVTGKRSRETINFVKSTLDIYAML